MSVVFIRNAIPFIHPNISHIRRSLAFYFAGFEFEFPSALNSDGESWFMNPIDHGHCPMVHLLVAYQLEFQNQTKSSIKQHPEE
jgi:hypothetical protein